jgi:transposase
MSRLNSLRGVAEKYFIALMRGVLDLLYTVGCFLSCNSLPSLQGMFFKFSLRKNPSTQKIDSYYRLVEGLRDEDGKVKHRTLLNVGFLEQTFSFDQINTVCRILNNRYQHKVELFAVQVDGICLALANELWEKLIAQKKIDPEMYSEHSRKVVLDEIVHKEGKEIGAEWMCYQTLQDLGVERVLLSQGFTEHQSKLALTQIISRAVYPASELRTSKWIVDNSAVCELTKDDISKITKDKLYDSALRLYGVKTALEQHLSTRTNELFDITDKILLYDLTNTYFEGQKRNSKLAKFGRSKEKRSDAKIIVLALAVNTLGFIKYHSIHEGNMSDSNNLNQVLEKLSKNIHYNNPTVVIDAGIATEQNLNLIKSKGYKYVCVSRVTPKDYEVQKNKLSVLLTTKSKQAVLLKSLNTPGQKDFFMSVESEAKALKEQSMKTQFEERFEDMLRTAVNALSSKSGIKQYDKVLERIGRAKQKYPSVAKYYVIEIKHDDKTNIVSEITWHKDETLYAQKIDGLGKYFIRTNIDIVDEVELWNIYNIIREIESTFRCLKTDLDLRPIYHKNDESTMAHLHLGLLAYWVVNTIRQRLKLQNINTCWTEILRIANTQKIITTEGQNTVGKVIRVKKCTEPNEALKKMYSALLMDIKPFHKKKSVVHKPELKKPQTLLYQALEE